VALVVEVVIHPQAMAVVHLVVVVVEEASLRVKGVAVEVAGGQYPHVSWVLPPKMESLYCGPSSYKFGRRGQVHTNSEIIFSIYNVFYRSIFNHVFQKSNTYGFFFFNIRNIYV
jgi:hypothetical protein